MRRLWTLLAAVMLVAVLLPTLAQAAGYSIYEQGAAALGMAGAATASVNDASAVFFNPAAMTRLEGTRIYVGGSALQPVTKFTGQEPNPGAAGSADMVRQTFYPPTVYATHGWAKRWAAGVGINSPFGLGVEWAPETFAGRYLVTKADLQGLNGSLCLAYAPNAKWSFAAGGDMMWAKVGLKNQVYRDLSALTGGLLGTTHVADVDLTSDFTPAPGWNAAVLFTPTSEWKVGAYYRSKVVVHVDEGTADFTNIPTGIPSLDGPLAAVLKDQGVSTVLRFPAMWSVGAAWNPKPEWTVEADLNYHEWKVFSDLPVDFASPQTPDKLRVENYDNAWQVRTGAEYRRGSLAYRAGYYFDKSPAPLNAVTPLLPDADRHGLTLGLGCSLGTDKRWTVDVYELAIFARPRVGVALEELPSPYDEFTGEYKTFVNAVGFGVGYRW
jgi:long-chain fatty acid transport protein